MKERLQNENGEEGWITKGIILQARLTSKCNQGSLFIEGYGVGVLWGFYIENI